MRDWDRRAAQRTGSRRATWSTTARQGDDEGLLKRFGQTGEGWLVADSMRSVDPNVAVEVQEPFEERPVEPIKHDLRLSEVIAPFGVGAIVDVRGESLIAPDTSWWHRKFAPEIQLRAVVLASGRR